MEVWGDIAAVFHWPPSEMANMSIPDLVRWHSIAIDRHKKLNSEASN